MGKDEPREIVLNTRGMGWSRGIIATGAREPRDIPGPEGPCLALALGLAIAGGHCGRNE